MRERHGGCAAVIDWKVDATKTQRGRPRERVCRYTVAAGSLRRRATLSKEPCMKIEGEGQLLRVFLDESDAWEGQPLYAAIVQRARAEGLAGATVLRGLMGFGANSLIHAPSRNTSLPEDMPIVVEIVDKAEKIKKFIPVLDMMVREGLITLEKVTVIAYRSSRRMV
jgi:PII-like signaling protein